MDIQTKFQTHKDKATQTSEQKQYNEKPLPLFIKD